ncbi:relaxin receptor 1-like, partial [Saccostrea cucullata]|uniref:relaxin receptor 1-like n=1 Tax=Saccostrea cuccullata TaxID=36930 RepID=UPI002ED016E4
DLSNNEIENISERELDFFFVSQINLQHNKITTIENSTFDSCPSLRKLNLNSNSIVFLKENAFPVYNKVEELKIENNLLTILTKEMFPHLRHVKRLYLGFNKIYHIEVNTFQELSQLKVLSLISNRLTTIKDYFFHHLTNLDILYIDENAIFRIEDRSFASLTSLHTLGLSKNRIMSVSSGVFQGLENLTHLNLVYNQIVKVSPNALRHLKKLVSLDLRKNAFRSLQKQTLRGLSSLHYVYFDEFYMCAYVPSDVVCQPFGDGISSRYNLLENGFLRIMVWLVAICACFGNLLVLLGRSLLREDNQVHSFYIKNLSFADMLMGIYLIIIGYHDQKFRGSYLVEDEGWRSSATCDLCGILSTLSNEASVLTLTLITLDRYISITLPLFRRRKSFKFALMNVSIIWIISLFLSVLPVILPDFFGVYFYKDNAVCVPFHLHRPWVRGWQYSVFLFLGLNLAAFTFICFAYITMFVAIKRSTKTVRSHFENKERTLVKRFFFIILTDFLCWMPIIIIKFIAISGEQINQDTYAWLIIFVMPINSAINPLLYTLTTKLFKEKVMPKLCCGFKIVRQEPILKETSPSSSSSSTGGRRNRSSIRSSLEKDLCEVGANTLRVSSRKLKGNFDSSMNEDCCRSGNYLSFKTRSEMNFYNNSTGRVCEKETLYIPQRVSTAV